MNGNDLNLKKGGILRKLSTLCVCTNDFRNLGGGYIIIGIKENKGRPALPPTGLNIKENDSLILDSMQFSPIITLLLCNGKNILVLWVLGGHTRPSKAKVGLGKGNNDYAYTFVKVPAQ